MTQAEKFKTLMDEFGVELIDVNVKGCFAIDTDSDCDKIKGYSGFITEFEFDEDGNFISVGIWE